MMPEDLIEEVPSTLQVKNTFIHYEQGLEDDLQDESVGFWKRQGSAPATSMTPKWGDQKGIGEYSKLTLEKLQHNAKGFKTEVDTKGTDEDTNNSFGEPEAEPRGWSRQVSTMSAGSLDAPIGGSFCRQETSEAWPTWHSVPTVPMVQQQQQQVPYMAMNMPWPAFADSAMFAPDYGYAGSVDSDRAAEDESKGGKKGTKGGMPRSRRKNKSLITLAYQAQVRQQSKFQPNGFQEPPEADETETPPPSEHGQQRANFCPYCGGTLVPGAKFCSFCGTSVDVILQSLQQ
jgi:hypothetical protein